MFKDIQSYFFRVRNNTILCVMSSLCIKKIFDLRKQPSDVPYEVSITAQNTTLKKKSYIISYDRFCTPCDKSVIGIALNRNRTYQQVTGSEITKRVNYGRKSRLSRVFLT